MHILLATPTFGPQRGGAEEWVAHYATWLHNHRHRVSIVAETASGDPPGGCTLHTLPAARRNLWQRALALQQLAQTLQPDVIHDTGCLPAADVEHPLPGSIFHSWYRQMRSYPAKLRRRRLLHIRVWRELRASMRLELHQLRHSRCVVACSQVVARDFAQLRRAPDAIIRNGIRLPPSLTTAERQSLRQQHETGNRRLALVTASNFHLKGVNTILRALATLPAVTRDKLLVLIAGQVRDPSFPAFIAAHRLEDCCRLLGWVDADPLFAAADIFLQPSHHDSGSLAVLKALAAGCNVISSRYDGSSELIRHGVNGLIMQTPGNHQELLPLLERALTEDALGQQARQLAPELVEEKQFAQLEALYR
jgi:glycosyltransferase involved in cell wall biosynthesis